MISEKVKTLLILNPCKAKSS